MRRAVEWLTAKVGVGLDCHRPLRGPLARPAWWVADVLLDVSWWAHVHRGGSSPLYDTPMWHNTRRSHRPTPGWGYIHPLKRGGR